MLQYLIRDRNVFKTLLKRLILKGKHTKGETHMCKLSSCDFTVNHVKYCVISVELQNICFLELILTLR